ncbi:MAG: DUF937 domain-containing protein [Anaerolineae bacterium]
MDTILNSLMQQLGGDTLRQLSGQLGTDDNSTQKAVNAALPVLIGALGRNAAKPTGARSLSKALARDHDGSVLDDIAGYLSGGGRPDDGAGILRHTLGRKQGKVEQGLSQVSGLDLGSIAKLLPLLAPLVMGMLGRTQRQQGLDASGLAGLLGGERQQADSVLGDLGPLLGALGSGGSSGGLMDLLGGLLGRR